MSVWFTSELYTYSAIQNIIRIVSQHKLNRSNNGEEKNGFRMVVILSMEDGGADFMSTCKRKEQLLLKSYAQDFVERLIIWRQEQCGVNWDRERSLGSELNWIEFIFQETLKAPLRELFHRLDATVKEEKGPREEAL